MLAFCAVIATEEGGAGLEGKGDMCEAQRNSEQRKPIKPYLFVTNRELALRLFVVIHKRGELLDRGVLHHRKGKLDIGLGVLMTGLDPMLR